MNDPIARSLDHTLISPSETDPRVEPATVVDGLYAITRALNRLADAVATDREP